MKDPNRRRRWLAGAFACVAVSALAACSSSSPGTASSPAASSSSTASSSAAAATGTGTVPASIAALWSSGSGACGAEANFVAYVCGKPGTANPNLAPVDIGWSNDQGGSIISEGPEATAAAQLAVNWINKYADGIDGHPLKLITCFIENSESEGKGCADEFLANPDIHVVSYGATAVGATTMDATIAGKIPIIEGFALNPSDVTNPNTYVLFTASPFDYYAWGTFAQQVLHATSMAIVYPEGTGFQNSAEAAVVSAKSLGISVKSVGYDPSSTDLTGALVAAGAQTAGMVVNVGGTPSTCVAIYKGLEQLGINQNKVVGDFSCGLDSEKAAYGGDLPHWYYGEAQSGDALTNDPIGQQYRAALAAFGSSSDASDVWYSGMFGSIATIAQFMNKVGYANITGTALANQAKAFRGPLLLGEPNVYCGKYPSAPANCGGGDRFFKYEGNGDFVPVSTWTNVPLPLQKELHAKGV
jgi:branched-chain amino acid transport system substrate-binding protein